LRAAYKHPTLAVPEAKRRARESTSADVLARLADLHERGDVTDEELQAAKARWLS
jgi:hypothetical protein